MRLHTFAAVFGCVLIAACDSHQDARPDVFRSLSPKFSITKPKGWFFGTNSLGGDVVTIERYQEPYDALNASVRVAYSALAPGPPVGLLQAIIANSAQKEQKTLRVLTAVGAASLAGGPAATATVEWDSEHEGKPYTARRTYWLLPRGDHAFLIFLDATPEEAKRFAPEFASMLSSITID